MTNAPDGFAPLFRSSNFLDLIGPFYQRGMGRELVVGVRIAEKHVNARGFAHGGLLMTLCDIALGYAAATTHDPPLRAVTASLTTDFAGSAQRGDWVEAHVDVHKIGSRLVFANAYLTVGAERIVRASAVFARTDGPRGGAAPALRDER